MPLDVFVGHKFGKLTVVGFERRQGKSYKKTYAKCECECGEEKYILWSNIASGRSTSCGCAQPDALKRMHQERENTFFTTRDEEIYLFFSENPHMSLTEVAEHFHVSRQWVSQVVKMYEPKPYTLADLRLRRRAELIQQLDERKKLLIEVERLRAQVEELMRGKEVADNSEATCQRCKQILERLEKQKEEESNE